MANQGMPPPALQVYMQLDLNRLNGQIAAVVFSLYVVGVRVNRMNRDVHVKIWSTSTTEECTVASTSMHVLVLYTGMAIARWISGSSWWSYTCKTSIIINCAIRSNCTDVLQRCYPGHSRSCPKCSGSCLRSDRSTGGFHGAVVGFHGVVAFNAHYWHG